MMALICEGVMFLGFVWFAVFFFFFLFLVVIGSGGGAKLVDDENK